MPGVSSIKAADLCPFYLRQGVYDFTGGLIPQGVYIHAGSDAIVGSCLELFSRPARHS